MEQYDNVIKEFVKYLDLDGSKEDMDAVVEQMKQKVQQVAVHTMIENMGTEQREELLKILNSGDKDLEKNIYKMAVSVPGLWVKIEQAINVELDLIKDIFKKDN